MNYNVDYFKDPKNQLMQAVEKALLQANIIHSVIPSKSAENLITQLTIIETLYTPVFSQFILSQVVEDGKIVGGDTFLNIGDGYFKISVSYHKDAPDNARKKWYKF